MIRIRNLCVNMIMVDSLLPRKWFVIDDKFSYLSDGHDKTETVVVDR